MGRVESEGLWGGGDEKGRMGEEGWGRRASQGHCGGGWRMEGGRVGGAGSEGQLWVGMGERIEGAGGGAAEDESRGLV